MTCDFAVWSTASPLSTTDAEKLYYRLCNRDSSGVRPHPGIEAFYNELTAQLPEMGEANGDDDCPWSERFHRSEGHILMSCEWYRAEDVQALAKQLASKYGLTFYDRQSEEIIHPEPHSPSAPKPHR